MTVFSTGEWNLKGTFKTHFSIFQDFKSGYQTTLRKRKGDIFTFKENVKFCLAHFENIKYCHILSASVGHCS